MSSSDLRPRLAHVSARLGHCVVFFSGHTNNLDLHSLRYNPYTDRCLQYEITGEMEVPRTRADACAVNIGKDIFMFGGWDPYLVIWPAILNDVWKLSYDEDSENLYNLKWEEIKVEPASATPSPRCGHCAWEYKDLLWTFGGAGPTPSLLANEGHMCLHEYGEFRDDRRGQNNQLLSFNPSIPQWINHDSKGATPCPRTEAAAAVIGATVWLYGGYDYNDYADGLDDLYQLDMDSLTWTQIQIQGTEPPFMLHHTLNPLSEQSLLLCSGRNLMVLKVLAPGIIQLSKLTTPNRCIRRTSHTATTIRGNNVVIFGGHVNGNCIPTNDLFVLFSNHMTLLQLATRTLYKHLEMFALRDIPVVIRKVLFFPTRVQGEFKM